MLVNIGSVEGELPLALQSSYAATKSGVLSLGRTRNEELRLAGKGDSIKVGTILPWAVDTPWWHHSANYTGHAPRMVAMDDTTIVVDARPRAPGGRRGARSHRTGSRRARAAGCLPTWSSGNPRRRRRQRPPPARSTTPSRRSRLWTEGSGSGCGARKPSAGERWMRSTVGTHRSERQRAVKPFPAGIQHAEDGSNAGRGSAWIRCRGQGRHTTARTAPRCTECSPATGSRLGRAGTPLRAAEIRERSRCLRPRGIPPPTAPLTPRTRRERLPR